MCVKFKSKESIARNGPWRHAWQRQDAAPARHTLPDKPRDSWLQVYKPLPVPQLFENESKWPLSAIFLI